MAARAGPMEGNRVGTCRLPGDRGRAMAPATRAFGGRVEVGAAHSGGSEQAPAPFEPARSREGPRRRTGQPMQGLPVTSGGVAVLAAAGVVFEQPTCLCTEAQVAVRTRQPTAGPTGGAGMGPAAWGPTPPPLDRPRPAELMRAAARQCNLPGLSPLVKDGPDRAGRARRRRLPCWAGEVRAPGSGAPTPGAGKATGARLTAPAAGSERRLR